MEYLMSGMALIMTVGALSCLLIGVVIGVIVGALPGLGSVVGITLCLPFTFSMDKVSAIALLLGVYAGSVYGGSISAVLINTPGTPASAATCFDGFPMAKSGHSEKALGWATMASVFGGLFSCAVLLFAAPQLAALAMKFGPVETCALILLGLTCISTVSEKSQFKGIFAGTVGLMLSIVGQDPMTGDERFTFNFFALSGGMDLIAVLVGTFALSEVFIRIDIVVRENVGNIIKCSGLILPRLAEWKGRFVPLLKSSIIGSLIGVLPGTGSSAAAFISYGEAKRTSPRKENMGKGEPDGIIAPEAANNAVTGGALVPSLALGLPGDAVTAVMLATLIMHGVTPGVRLMVDSPDIVYSIFIALCIANLLLIPIGYLVAKGFAWMLKLPESLLLPIISLLCLLGSYSVRNSFVDLWTTVIMGFVGVIFRYFKIPLAPLVIGLVLGMQFEISLRQSLIITNGSLQSMIFDHPIAAGLIVAVVFLLLAPVIKNILGRKKEAAAEQ